MLKKVMLAAGFALVLAVPAQAQSRDMGAGRLIAAQGNQALQLIQAEVKDAIRNWTPVLPARTAIRTVHVAGAAGTSAAVRCAP